MDMQSAIQAVTDRRDLATDEMGEVMHLIMTGQATQAQIGGFLIALRMKGETVDEMVGAARVMRELSESVRPQSEPLVDTCGTGGDGVATFNISTCAAFAVAAAGGKVAKHGNRSVSGRSGSADVLEAAGVYLDLTADQVAHCVDEVGVGFMFAPYHHSAMKHAVGPRKEMAVRTIFNLLGPLTNPAEAPHQVIGVYHYDWMHHIAEVMKRLGSRHVLVVHSADGLDEISLGDETHVVELKDGAIAEYRIRPEDFGMKRQSMSSLTVAGVEDSLAVMQRVLSRNQGAATDVVALNAGAAIYAADICRTLDQGVEMARDVLSTGLAGQRLEELEQFTGVFQAEAQSR